MPRRGHRAKRTVNAISQLKWRDVVNPYGPTEAMDLPGEQTESGNSFLTTINNRR
jgi:hypothetical protein